MKDRKYEGFFAFIKLFFRMCSLIFLSYLIVALIFDTLIKGAGYHTPSHSYIMYYAISFSLFWSVFNYGKYCKTALELSTDEYNGRDMLLEVKNILIPMRLKIVKEEADETVFKTSLFSHLLFERISAKLEEDKLIINGAAYYVEKVAEKLKYQD